jgi:hypothetical protein
MAGPLLVPMTRAIVCAGREPSLAKVRHFAAYCPVSNPRDGRTNAGGLTDTSDRPETRDACRARERPGYDASGAFGLNVTNKPHTARTFSA